MAEVLEEIIANPKFQGLDYPRQVAVMSNVLRQVSPDLATNEDALTVASEKAIRQYRPRSPFEKAGSFLSGFIPIAGPLIQQYGFQDNVPPPELLSMMGIVDDDNPYGGLIRAGLDIPLMVLGGLVGGVAVGQGAKWFPSLLNRTVPAFLGRELIAGAASGTGELVLDPPHSVPEATARLGLSAIGQAAFTAGGKMLFGAKARGARALKRELGEEGLAAFNTKVKTGDYINISDAEIGSFERALGTRKDQDAVNARADLVELKQRRNQVFADQEAEGNLAALKKQREERVGGSEDEYTKFQREQTAEQIAKESQTEGEAIQDSYFRSMTQEADQLQRERLIQTEQVGSQAFVKEHTRQKEIDGLIARTESGPVQRGSENFLQSERQLIDLLNDVKVHGEEGQTFPFIGNDPVTLPLAMIQDAGGMQRAVVVENLSGNVASLRSLGRVDRKTLRLPHIDEERLAIRRIEIEQGVKAYPDFPETKRILESRVEAERLTRLAGLESRRFNASEGGVQREIYGLRRDATLKYLDAHNSEVSTGAREKIQKTKSLDDKRTLASVESLSATDAEATAKALKSAGFENVRTALRPEGTFDVAFSNQDSPELSGLGRLHSRSITFAGTFDPTSPASYAGLTPADHERLGKAFGIAEAERSKFAQMAEAYTKELRDRGIRFPITTEALGVESIENQVASGAKRIQKMRSEIIANSEENVRRIDAGDVIEYQSQKGVVQLLVADKNQTFDPTGNDLGTTTYHVMPVAQLGEFDPRAGNMPTIPFTENQLKEMGAKRSVKFPISAEQQAKFSIASPSRNLGDLFGLERDQMPIPVVEGTERAIRQAARELGMKVGVSKDGLVRLSGNKIDLADLSPEDAALVLSRLKQFQQDRTSLLDFFGDCL